MTTDFLMVGSGIPINIIIIHLGIVDSQVILEDLTFTIAHGILHMVTQITTTMEVNLLVGSRTEVDIITNQDGIVDYQVILAVFIFIMIHCFPFVLYY